MIRRFVKLARTAEVFVWGTIARLQFKLRGAVWPKGFIVRGPLGLTCLGRLIIGKNVVINSLCKFNRAGINHPTQFVVGAESVLEIGENTGISGAVIYCAEAISIGSYVLVGANCKIYDTDFHPLDHMRRRSSARPVTAPVYIEDDVWLGADVVVLKGVTIGARSVIAARSVVTHNIPPDTLAAGVPAKPIRSLLGGN